jgi:drug/metabolite transporter (DMT)-like permease
MSRRAAALFGAVSILWGIPYALIAVALDHGAGPLLIAWVRVATGAAVLLAFAMATGRLRGLGAHRGALLAIALADVAAPLALLPYAERHVSSSLAGILVATTPLFVGVIGFLPGQPERVDARRWLGLLAGFAGVTVLVGGALSGALGAAALVLAAAAGYAVASILVRDLDDVSPVGVGAAALAVAAVLLAPAAGLDAGAPTARAWLPMLALGLLCTAAGFATYYLLIAEVGATTASLTTYVAPICSVAVGAIALGDAIGASALAGLALILAGSWQTARSR